VKQWPLPSFRHLAERLAALRGVRVLVLAAADEEPALQAVASGGNGGAVFRATGAAPDFVAVLRRAALAVGNDSGSVHLSAALGVRTVGLYGPTQAQINGPYGPRVRAIQSPTARMTDIAVDTVFDAAAGWLE
jgi:ADP-heptose:LPS heptosyltransferase